MRDTEHHRRTARKDGSHLGIIARVAGASVSAASMRVDKGLRCFGVLSVIQRAWLVVPSPGIGLFSRLVAVMVLSLR